MDCSKCIAYQTVCEQQIDDAACKEFTAKLADALKNPLKKTSSVERIKGMWDEMDNVVNGWRKQSNQTENM
jgi:hypothetical protein